MIRKKCMLFGLVLSLLTVGNSMVSAAADPDTADSRAKGIICRVDRDTVVISGEGSLTPYEIKSLHNVLESARNVRFEGCRILGNAEAIFKDLPDLESIDLQGLDTSQITHMGWMFSGCSGLTSLDVSGFDTSQVRYMPNMFEGCSGLTSLDVSGFDTGQVERMDHMFNSCSGLTSLDVSGFDTGQVYDMMDMFYGCSGLTSLDVSGFDTGKVTEMGGLFSKCSGLKSLDVSGFVAGQETNLFGMFWGCSGLASLNLSGFNTSQATEMGCMFADCSSLKSLDLSGFDTGSVTGMQSMFSGCSGLTSLDLSSFDTGQVTDMGWMFTDCSSLKSLDLSGFDTENVTNMSCMFSGCSGLESLDVSSFDTSSVAENNFDAGYGMVDIFSGCDSLVTVKAFRVPPTRAVCELPAIFMDENGNKTSRITAEFGGRTLHKAPAESEEPTEPDEIQRGDLTYRDGKYYFYENGIMAVSKEAYVNGAWRWFDADGTMAVDKDVYQTSSGGKWVRYNENGEMVKGEDYRYGGYYYFEPITGAMMKGPVILEDGRKVFYDTATGRMVMGDYTMNGQAYSFDENDGRLISGQDTEFWVNADGKDYWYEGWQRQGWNPADEAYRGKEIYDPASDAWYWLDNVQHGGKAVSKDVYQESYSAYPDREDGTGKWVRYDENGHMVKGWQFTDRGIYYFEEITGAMAKGQVTVGDELYYFDPATGIRQ